MIARLQKHDAGLLGPYWWRMLLVAVGAVILCSCRTPRGSDDFGAGVRSQDAGMSVAGDTAHAQDIAALAAGAPASSHVPEQRDEHDPRYPVEQATYAGAAPDPSSATAPGCAGCATCDPGLLGRAPGAGVVQQWAPPGIKRPWPRDEYLCDGGDAMPGAIVRGDWNVDGLEQEDTIAHYDTLDGRTEVTPSNRVCLYAPRFASVRHVAAVVQYDRRENIAEGRRDVAPGTGEDLQIASTTLQPEQPEASVAGRRSTIFRVRDLGSAISVALLPHEIEMGFLPYENFSVMKHGIFAPAERAHLMEMIDAAIVWSHDTAVQVVIEGQQALEATGDKRAQATFMVDLPPGKAKLRVLKIASTKHAQPGETVDFTLRYDNVGDQPVGNVTLIDNLTTRLELVPGSEKSDRKGTFSATPNDAGSMVLRWEIDEPLEPGDGGRVRFQCRVR
jgi:uncharacterized repeat protein (TIGR01451 family)